MFVITKRVDKSWTYSAAGATIKVVPVSRIAVLPCKLSETPFTEISSKVPSQNPAVLILGNSVNLPLNLEASTPPNVISPSLVPSLTRKSKRWK